MSMKRVFALVAFATVTGLLAQCVYPVPVTPVAAPDTQVETLQNEVKALRETVTRLSYNTASGGGVNVKMMPHPETGEPTVRMEEVFSFDRNHAMCRVDTNPEAFKMSTYEMGEVVVEPHQFFMSMVATSIEQYEVSTEADGSRRVVMRGGLECATEVGQATVTIGSRTATEHATYRIEAVDRGIGGGEAGDSFAFTVFFDPEDAPVNYAIFGPEFTFTGEMVAGEITIVDPRERNR
jgi:hypothetical protein